MATVIVSPQAERDMLAIWVYIAQDSRVAADKLLSSLEKKFATLAEMPGIGRERSELLVNLRSLPLRKYVVFYRPIEGGVEIVRVIHGARDLRRFFPQD
jgi:toxin ParE1/3/4